MICGLRRRPADVARWRTAAAVRRAELDAGMSLAQARATATRQSVEHQTSLDRLTHALTQSERPEAAALEALLAASIAPLSA